MSKVIFRNKKGFTLVELIIVIVLLGIVSFLGVNLLMPIMTGYTDTKVKDLLYNEAKFITERMAKELKYAIPNTVADFNNNCQPKNSNNIKFASFKDVYFYSKNDKDNISLTENVSINNNDFLSIYVTNCNQFYNEQRVYSVTDNDSGSYLILDKKLKKDSPYKRVFLYDKVIVYKLLNNQLYWCKGDINTDFNIDGDCYAFGNFLDNVEFTYDAGNRWRNAAVKISLTLKKNDVSINYEKVVHIRNAP